MKLNALETVLAKAIAQWYFGEKCDETFFDDAEIDTADSLMVMVNGRVLRGVKKS